jgi:hypothetical protein
MEQSGLTGDGNSDFLDGGVIFLLEVDLRLNISELLLVLVLFVEDFFLLHGGWDGIRMRERRGMKGRRVGGC